LLLFEKNSFYKRIINKLIGKDFKMSKVNKKKLGFWGLVIAGVFLIGSWLVGQYNVIPTLDEEVSAKWSTVLDAYKRRADLIPNLVETVKGYAIHERETLEGVIEARAKATQMTVDENMLQNPGQFAKFEAAQSALSSALGRLMVVMERYPELKASQNFMSLQGQLEGTENKISVARKQYIDTVKEYNTHVKRIPGKFIAALFFSDAGPKPQFTITEAEQQKPEVDFNFNK
jgi:LemA protein